MASSIPSWTNTAPPIDRGEYDKTRVFAVRTGRPRNGSPRQGAQCPSPEAVKHRPDTAGWPGCRGRLDGPSPPLPPEPGLVPPRLRRHRAGQRGAGATPPSGPAPGRAPPCPGRRCLRRRGRCTWRRRSHGEGAGAAGARPGTAGRRVGSRAGRANLA